MVALQTFVAATQRQRQLSQLHWDLMKIYLLPLFVLWLLRPIHFLTLNMVWIFHFSLFHITFGYLRKSWLPGSLRWFINGAARFPRQLLLLVLVKCLNQNWVQTDFWQLTGAASLFWKLVVVCHRSQARGIVSCFFVLADLFRVPSILIKLAKVTVNLRFTLSLTLRIILRGMRVRRNILIPV